MILLKDILNISDFKINLLNVDNNFKSTLIKEGNKLSYFNIFLFDSLFEKKALLLKEIEDIYSSEELFIRKLISVNYLKEDTYETDEVIMLSENRGNAISFSVREGLFILTVLFEGGEKELSFPSFKYISEFLEDGSCILYDENLKFNKELVSGLFYI